MAISPVPDSLDGLNARETRALVVALLNRLGGDVQLDGREVLAAEDDERAVQIWKSGDDPSGALRIVFRDTATVAGEVGPR